MSIEQFRPRAANDNEKGKEELTYAERNELADEQFLARVDKLQEEGVLAEGPKDALIQAVLRGVEPEEVASDPTRHELYDNLTYLRGYFRFTPRPNDAALIAQAEDAIRNLLRQHSA